MELPHALQGMQDIDDGSSVVGGELEDEAISGEMNKYLQLVARRIRDSDRLLRPCKQLQSSYNCIIELSMESFVVLIYPYVGRASHRYKEPK